MRDNEIREQFTEWAQPLHAAVPPAFSVIRRRARRRTARMAASGVTALAAVVVGALLLTSVLGAGRAPASGSRFLAGPLPRPDAGPASAPFYLTLAAGLGEPAVVHSADGRTLGRVFAPAGLLETWVAGAGDDRTFVLSAISSTWQTWFYEVRLSRTGRPGPLTRLNVPALEGRKVDGMAVSADGTELAVASELAGSFAPRPELEVISLATGAVRTWRSAGGYPTLLSWAETAGSPSSLS